MDFTTFRSRYWATEGEKRINRKQFVVRITLIFIIGVIASMIPGYILPELSLMENIQLLTGGKIDNPWLAIHTVIGICISYPFYRMSKATYIKRYADFNNNGKSPRGLLPIVFYGSVIIQVFILLRAYLGDVGLIDMLSRWMGLYIIGIVGVASQLMVGAIFCIFLMFIISAFTGGSNGSNNYGEEPTNNPLL